MAVVDVVVPARVDKISNSEMESGDKKGSVQGLPELRR